MCLLTAGPGTISFLEPLPIAAKPERFGDQLAAVANRAGKQNVLYLELMETVVLPQLFPLVGGIELTGDPAADYQTLMASPFGDQLEALVEHIQLQLAYAETRKRELLACGSGTPEPGCEVEIRFLHQVVRSLIRRLFMRRSFWVGR